MPAPVLERKVPPLTVQLSTLIVIVPLAAVVVNTLELIEGFVVGAVLAPSPVTVTARPIGVVRWVWVTEPALRMVKEVLEVNVVRA